MVPGGRPLPWVLLLVAVCCVGSVRGGFTLEQGIPHFNTKPYFLPPPAKNLTALEGQSAYIHCRVAQLGDKKVSWIRRRDLHVLTSGVHTFASDQRFMALHADRSENWTLHIRFSQVRDSGEYQCQVNTDPRISMIFFLHVQEAATLMDGSDQRYVRQAAPYSSCSTSIASQPPGLLYWYRDAEILQQGGRVNISTHLENETVSKLVIDGARVTDSGNYTCWPTKFLPASVMVHVIPEEKAAAKSLGTGSNGGGSSTTSNSKASASPPSADILLLLLLTLTMLTWTADFLLLTTTFPLCSPSVHLPVRLRPPSR
ncbi:zwei Ig domain protein zig-8-like [Homarus americanus]|uniref:Zwei Ig domain protein zig-8-like 5 n=1 Tax=Homarus americanus TaxID=6706 RepID=A0A8J5NDA5_HOMAM|nr:zwei Ig domain protein zig-8-like [Homarus americanus]XP_042216442.1 zwei Ig domain protein zig-8-like [Homarus americanus]XP_042216453.1 zwei Ig domain protein zig-8-like [Homarus americanus]XP_042216462.1 zwei Ig domain protein zig-8-like [Homarus americanus]KAG7177697.1 Zwei Ig domain protein zig-8-like 5 [Homarus americanus]